MSSLSKIVPFIGFLLFSNIISCKNDEVPEVETIEDEITADSNIIENEIPESNIKDPLTITPDGSENYLNFDSEYIFNQESLHTFDLVLSEENLNLLNADPTAEEYVQGMLVFENDTVSPVGIRYKGSIGAFVGCVDGPNWFEPSGSKICTKLSMKIKINWEGRSEKFYGQKKLQFHSMNNDDSQMHERAGYWLFRQMGVPAPRAVHARLNINGIYTGIYALVEQIDSRFIKENFDDDEGNLYKEIWPLSSAGMPYPVDDYVNALKTNENDHPNVDLIRDFGQKIAMADEENLQEIISAHMNTNEIVSYAVVDRLIRNDDGAFHWYCDDGVCTNHNYYWYEEPSTAQLHLIPWDLDNAFENILSNTNPVTPIADQWGGSRNDCEPFGYGPWALSQKSAACDKLTRGWAKYTETYETLKIQFINGPFSVAQIDQQIETWVTQITEAHQEANNLYEDAESEESWVNEINLFKAQLKKARQH
ncbi:MAG: CotH kinase family protein [Cyclobacteriaceae bacterium]|jgi:spore coat protein CotH|nr:hypothetical protein [Flammeovirgaceae bacterium]MDG1106462.1 CotH kinase family protein [Cyclobacteriaceae bacterium]